MNSSTKSYCVPDIVYHIFFHQGKTKSIFVHSSIQLHNQSDSIFCVVVFFTMDKQLSTKRSYSHVNQPFKYPWHDSSLIITSISDYIFPSMRYFTKRTLQPTNKWTGKPDLFLGPSGNIQGWCKFVFLYWNQYHILSLFFLPMTN